MAEPDFNDLLNAAEQLASDIEGSKDLPRVDRTLRQVLEASQDLWTRVTTEGSQDIQANLLLGSKGVDLPQLSQKLESLSTRKTFEPLEPIPDTDIEGFLKNESENIILSLIDSTHSEIQQKLKMDLRAHLVNEWESEKINLLNSMLGKEEKEYIDFSTAQQKTVLNESVLGTKSFLNRDEMKYAHTLIEYQQMIIEGASKVNLIEKFVQTAVEFNDQMVNDMWMIVKYMTQLPVQGKGDPIGARNTSIIKAKMIQQARSYLENRYRIYMNSVVQSNMREAQRGGKPGIYSLVRSFVGIKHNNGYTKFDSVEVDGCPLWALVYYCIRCGDSNAALEFIKKAGPQYTEICKAFEEIGKSDSQTLSIKEEKFIRSHYKRGVRNDSDPYKKILFCILGRCDVNEEHAEIVKTADDYLWLKLNQVYDIKEQEDHTVSEGRESISYSTLQSLVIEEYGERHYNANEQPHVYFQLLFLTGQWEASIDFLMRNDKLRVHGVHIAIVLHDLDMIGLPMDMKSPLLVVDPSDPKPMHRLNMARLIMLYVQKFENQDICEAIHYYYCLRNVKIANGDTVFAVCVSELVMKTRKFDDILGCMELDGCRSPGLIDTFRGSLVDVDMVIERVAYTAETSGQYEDAIKLYDLGGRHEEVLRLMSTLMSQVVSRVDNEPGSLRARLSNYADNITNRYFGVQLKCDQGTQAAFYTLRDLLKFFDLYAKNIYPEALEIIQRSRLIPLSMDEIDDKIKNFQTLNEVVARNIPDVLLATMTMLYSQFTKIKGDSQNSSRSFFPDSSKEQLTFLRERAKALTSFAGTIPYRMPGDANSRLVQMEILMH
uniref:Nuclear pore protein n=1 Tax=Clastoptera arizonana TaxID=38151 RepID=A0A1B6CIL9_9HEMI